MFEYGHESPFIKSSLFVLRHSWFLIRYSFWVHIDTIYMLWIVVRSQRKNWTWGFFFPLSLVFIKDKRNCLVYKETAVFYSIYFLFRFQLIPALLPCSSPKSTWVVKWFQEILFALFPPARDNLRNTVLQSCLPLVEIEPFLQWPLLLRSIRNP